MTAAWTVASDPDWLPAAAGAFGSAVALCPRAPRAFLQPRRKARVPATARSAGHAGPPPRLSLPRLPLTQPQGRPRGPRTRSAHGACGTQGTRGARGARGTRGTRLPRDFCAVASSAPGPLSRPASAGSVPRFLRVSIQTSPPCRASPADRRSKVGCPPRPESCHFLATLPASPGQVHRCVCSFRRPEYLQPSLPLSSGTDCGTHGSLPEARCQVLPEPGASPRFTAGGLAASGFRA